MRVFRMYSKGDCLGADKVDEVLQKLSQGATVDLKINRTIKEKLW